jgi:hypothetical protein
MGWTSPDNGLCVNREIIITQESSQKIKHVDKCDRLGVDKIFNYGISIATKLPPIAY